MNKGCVNNELAATALFFFDVARPEDLLPEDSSEHFNTDFFGIFSSLWLSSHEDGNGGDKFCVNNGGGTRPEFVRILLRIRVGDAGKDRGCCVSLRELETEELTLVFRGDKHLFSSKDGESLLPGPSVFEASTEGSPVGVLGGVGP